MDMQTLFYGIGIFFLFLTILYFVFSYLRVVPSEVKAVLSFMLALIFFIGADYLRRLGR